MSLVRCLFLSLFSRYWSHRRDGQDIIGKKKKGGLSVPSNDVTGKSGKNGTQPGKRNRERKSDVMEVP